MVLVGQDEVSPHSAPSPLASVHDVAGVVPEKDTVNKHSMIVYSLHVDPGVIVIATLKPSVTVGLKKSKLEKLVSGQHLHNAREY